MRLNIYFMQFPQSGDNLTYEIVLRKKTEISIVAFRKHTPELISTLNLTSYVWLVFKGHDP